jgi:hypothetical protein
MAMGVLLLSITVFYSHELLDIRLLLAHTVYRLITILHFSYSVFLQTHFSLLFSRSHDSAWIITDLHACPSIDQLLRWSLCINNGTLVYNTKCLQQLHILRGCVVEALHCCKHLVLETKVPLLMHSLWHRQLSDTYVWGDSMKMFNGTYTGIIIRPQEFCIWNSVAKPVCFEV